MWVKECKLHTSRKWEDRFFNSLVRAWKAIREGILYNIPFGQEELVCQPILWKPIYMSAAGRLVGMRSHLAWGSLAHGPARTIGSWISFCALSEREWNNMLRQYRGGCMMYAEIEQMMNNISQDHSSPYMWIGIFSRT